MRLSTSRILGFGCGRPATFVIFAAVVLCAAGPASALINPRFTPINLVEQATLVALVKPAAPDAKGKLAAAVGKCLKGKAPARLSLDLIRFLVNLSAGVVQASAILLTFRPDVIVGTGGFASAPVLLAILLASLAMGFVQRAMPQFHFLSTGAPVRVVIGLIVIASVLSLPVLVELLGRATSVLDSSLRTCMEAKP